MEEQRVGAGEEGEMTEEGTIGPMCFASWKDFVPRCDKICRKNTAAPEPVMFGTPGQVFVQHHGSSTFVTWSGVILGILRQIRVGVSVCPITSNSQYMIHYNLMFGRGLQPSLIIHWGWFFGDKPKYPDSTCLGLEDNADVRPAWCLRFFPPFVASAVEALNTLTTDDAWV